MQKSNTVFAVSSFTGEGFSGNKHLVFLPLGSVDTAAWKGASASIDDFIIVVVEHMEKVRRAHFFHRGRQVNRCGSGSLALAHVLIEKLGDKPPLSIDTPSGLIYVGKGERLYYETTYLPIVATQSRPWSSLVNCSVCSAHLIGGADDYCIIELANEKALRRCVVNARRTQLTKKRAIIVTSLSSDSSSDYVMRYFAPQYGNYEDSATGSANAMLALFWQKKLNKKAVIGKQLSLAGGLFRVQNIGLKQRVFGWTTELGEIPEMDLLMKCLQ